ncbi:MAG: PAS domain S-box protein [Methanosarcina sp.]
MIGQIRKSGIDIIGDVPWGTHICQFYQTKEDLLEVLVSYFKAGLENNEFCLWVTSEPLEVEDAKEVLEKTIPDFNNCLEKGQIEIVPYTEWFIIDGVFNPKKVSNNRLEKLNRALKNGFDGMRLSGNTTWLDKENWDSFIKFKEQTDRCMDTYRMINLCTYSVERHNAAEIIDVVVNHQFALIKREGRWEKIESPKRKQAEEAAVQAAKNWEYTFDAVPDLISILDTEYRIVRANKAMAESLGLTPQECTGLTCYHAVHGTDEPPSFCPHRQLLKDGLEHIKEVHEESLGGDFIVSVSPLYDSQGKVSGCIHVARNINERKQAEEALRQRELRVRSKLEKVLSPEREMIDLDLAEIVDTQVIQPLMDSFFKLTHIPVGLNDLKGNVLAGAGWQDICTKFHRLNPESCKNCIENDIKLSESLLPGEFRLCKCKNNMWDIGTPVIIEGQKVGSFFAGQFYFEDETPDYEIFRIQARKYGFNEDEYIAALDKVPRLNREFVNNSMDFFIAFASMVSQLSYSNFKLARSLEEHNTLMNSLRESEERFRSVLENSLDAAYRRNFQNDCYDYISPVIKQITGFSVQEMNAMSTNDLLNRIHPDDYSMVVARLAQSSEEGFGTFDYRFKCKDGKYRWLADHFSVIKDQNGSPFFRAGIARDITESKQVEKELREKREDLNRAQAVGNIGSWRLDLRKNELTWSDENHRIFGIPKGIPLTYETFISIVHPDDKEYVDKEWKAGLAGEPYDIEHRIVTDGKTKWVREKAYIEFDKDGAALEGFGITQDITKRKQVERELRASEARLRFALETSHTGAWDLDLVDRTAYRSLEHDRIFGYEQLLPEWTYEMFLDHVLPEDRAMVDAKFNKATTTCSNWNFECRIRRVDGEIRWIWAAGRHRLDANWGTRRLAGIVQDITERKQAEEALQESEKRFRTLSENSPDVITRFDKQNRHLYVNPAAAEVYCRSQDEIQGKTHKELGEDPEKVEFWEKCHQNVFETGESQTIEFRYISPQGKIHYFNTRLVPEFLDGKVDSVLAISRDITDTKVAEARLKEAHDNLEKLVEKRTAQLENAYKSLKESETSLSEAQKMAHLGNWDWNIVTGKIYWSEGLYRIFGLKPQESGPRYSEFLNHVHPDDRDYVNNAIRKNKDDKFCSIDFRIILADETERIVHAENEIICNEKNVPIRVRGIVQDITERKKAEEALANIEAARKKEIHHRIKNNLQVISSLLDLQVEKFGEKESFEDFEVLNAFRESQDRVASIALIHEELHEGKGTNTLNFSPYLYRLVENLFQTYTVGKDNVKLQMELEENVFFDMDTAVPLGLIVNEIVSNSLKYAFKGREKGEVQIKLFRQRNGELEGKTAGLNEDLRKEVTNFILTVSDDGTGLPENFSLEDSDTLGLQLVSILTDQLEGKLELKRDYGTEYVIKFSVNEKE